MKLRFSFLAGLLFAMFLNGCGEDEKRNSITLAEEYTKLRQWERAKNALANIEETDPLFPKSVEVNRTLDSSIYDIARYNLEEFDKPQMALHLLKLIEEDSEYYDRRRELEEVANKKIEEQKADITTSIKQGSQTSIKQGSQTSNKRGFTFILTHMLGQKMPKNASFNVGEFDTWILDFNNGDRLRFNIISMNPNNPMCGITARDNFGDMVDICITKTSGDGVAVELKYGSRRVNYKGFLQR